jgi:hypothetical protein
MVNAARRECEMVPDTVFFLYWTFTPLTALFNSGGQAAPLSNSIDPQIW